MREFTTPMMRQYKDIKSKYSDCLLFFRLGDFYELFMEDAHIGAQVLGITLTGRPKGRDGRIPMAGVPFHAVDSYISKLVKAGYKVAICEQITEPSKKGIVEREVVRVVTPGTLLDEKALEGKENNYICAINMNEANIAFVYCDITTGTLQAEEFNADNISQTISDFITRLKPAECILPPKLYDDTEILNLITQNKMASAFPVQTWGKLENDANATLKKQFKVSTLAGFNIEDKPLVIKTTSVLLNYLKETQKNELTHITKIILKSPETFVQLDRATIINLELFSTIRDRDTSNSFLSAIDKTRTAMGGRMLKTWVAQPLTNKNHIQARLDAVEELTNNNQLFKKTHEALRDMNDLERILSRISIGIGNARDLMSLAANMRLVFAIKHALTESESVKLQKLQKEISTKLWDMIFLIENAIVENPPIQVKDGGLIKEKFNADLDKIRTSVSESKDWLSILETTERTRTGISSLKLRYNKVFGFYIEISNSNLHLIPDNYIRKQTLTNGERFITPELKEKEDLILRNEEELKSLEYKIYKEIVEKTTEYTNLVQKAALSIAQIDCLLSHTSLAKEGRYKKPTIVYSQELRIKNGRHPVVERNIGYQNFVPNSISFGPSHASLYLITGPNMAGKSVYLRQTALIVLMALIGCFVPAQSAQISVVDAIFVRSGASDLIASGLSTFMVEMVETAYILNQATNKSLIIMDEIGRGTSTYDGVSIAWATAEYLVSHFKPTPKTLFATHYLELTKLEKKFPRKIKNIHMSVSEENNALTFLHLVKAGSAKKSFGIAVASLAGMPEEVVSNAYSFLQKLETTENLPKTSNSVEDNNKFEEKKLINEISKIDVNKITPIDALNFLNKVKSKIK